MDIIKCNIAISECQKELTQTLVDGVESMTDYWKIVGQINGLETSKRLIQKVLEESTHAGDTENDTDDD
jgi:hypothetical protein